MNEAQLRGINMRSLKRERFSSRNHQQLVERHELELQRYYGHPRPDLLHRLDVGLNIALQQLRGPQKPVRERKMKPFEPTQRQLEIALQALENAA